MFISELMHYFLFGVKFAGVSGEGCKTLKNESEYDLNQFCMSKNSMQIHGKRQKRCMAELNII